MLVKLISFDGDKFELEPQENVKVVMHFSKSEFEDGLSAAKAHAKKVWGDETILVMSDGTEINVLSDVIEAEAAEETPAE